MIRLLSLLAMAFALANPAHAHKLKVFATVEGGTIKGYAFFIGGGRAEHTPWLAKDRSGNGIANGTTDGEGRFTFAIPQLLASDVTIIVDTREGHVASIVLGAGQIESSVPGGSAQAETRVQSTKSAETDEKITGLVEAAVQRQMGRVMEQIDRMDSRMRFTDVISGIFLILGSAGMALWAISRRK